MLAPDTTIDWKAERDLRELKRAHSLITQDREAAMKALEAIASRGSVMAMVYLGGMYSGSAKEEDVDIDNAIHWYRMAFDCGSVYSSYCLGDSYLRAGKYRCALEVLQWGADRKFILAMWLLGAIYYQGKAVPRNIEKARCIWAEATALGHVCSKRHLAHLYMRKYFGMRNVPKGVLLFMEALSDIIRITARRPNSDLLKG